MDISEPLCFENGAKWREWLKKHHDTSSGVWLLHYKVGAGKAGLTRREALDEALNFGWIDTKLKSLGSECYILRYVPRQPGSLWSKINKDRAEELISQGRMTPFGLAAIEEARRNGRWEAAYTLLKPWELPEDLRAALSRNATAWQHFRAFANSYRNMYINWVSDAKTESTRGKRISEVVRLSEANIKPGQSIPRRSAGRPPR